MRPSYPGVLGPIRWCRAVAAGVGLVGGHEWVAVVARGNERLIDGTRAVPADQVPHRAGLVVRPGGARAAERLLADDGARRLVVDVEVAGRVAERLLGLDHRVAVVREDCAGQPVGRAAVDET